MLRRTFQGARFVSLAIGLALLLWIPLSFFVLAKGAAVWSTSGVWYVSYSGQSTFVIAQRTPKPRHYAYFQTARAWPSIEFKRTEELQWRMSALRPEWGYIDESPDYEFTNISLPIWALAVLTLGWPIASLVARRRRHRRGFTVDATQPREPLGATGGQSDDSPVTLATEAAARKGSKSD